MDTIDVTVVLVNLRQREPWRDQAACRGESPDEFYAERGGSIASRRLITDLCERCPARWPCLAHALARNEPGTWAVMERDRRALRRGKPLRLRHEGVVVTVDWDAHRQTVRLWDRGHSTAWTTTGAVT